MDSIKIVVNVLDDEEAILIAVKDTLSYRPDFIVHCFSKVSDFLSQIDSSVDLVITDVRLNQGIEINDIITEIQDKNPNGYIVVMSAYLDMPLAKWLNNRGIKFVEKNDLNWIEELKDLVEVIYPNLRRRAASKDLF